LLAFFVYNSIAKVSKKGGRRHAAPRVETGTQKQEVADEDWLQGTSVDTRLRKKPAPKSPRASSK
jgi:hypothetical protein